MRTVGGAIELGEFDGARPATATIPILLAASESRLQVVGLHASGATSVEVEIVEFGSRLEPPAWWPSTKQSGCASCPHGGAGFVRLRFTPLGTERFAFHDTLRVDLLIDGRPESVVVQFRGYVGGAQQPAANHDPPDAESPTVTK